MNQSPRFKVRTLFWLTLVVAVFLAGRVSMLPQLDRIERKHAYEWAIAGYEEADAHVKAELRPAIQWLKQNVNDLE